LGAHARHRALPHYAGHPRRCGDVSVTPRHIPVTTPRVHPLLWPKGLGRSTEALRRILRDTRRTIGIDISTTSQQRPEPLRLTFLNCGHHRILSRQGLKCRNSTSADRAGVQPSPSQPCRMRSYRRRAGRHGPCVPVSPAWNVGTTSSGAAICSCLVFVRHCHAGLNDTNTTLA
jgi:hypothetical protein